MMYRIEPRPFVGEASEKKDVSLSPHLGCSPGPSPTSMACHPCKDSVGWRPPGFWITGSFLRTGSCNLRDVRDLLCLPSQPLVVPPCLTRGAAGGDRRCGWRSLPVSCPSLARPLGLNPEALCIRSGRGSLVLPVEQLLRFTPTVESTAGTPAESSCRLGKSCDGGSSSSSSTSTWKA